MEKRRILNRIIFINVAHTDYSCVEIAGNTCFVGTNNLGKTTFQRAVLFFYSANTRGLGISSSQRSFEDYYFQYPNSYLIYEIATEEGFFHVIVYRNNKLYFRFVDGAYNQDQYIVNNEALLMKEILGRFNMDKIGYSDQIETFERYRNIIYGADPDKKYKKFSLMKGNSMYHNIPLAISAIFLSSEATIKAEFVKDCIANSISTKHTNIELKTIERQLRQFSERYQDIETYFRKDNNQRGDLIKDNFQQIKNLKAKQKALAIELGGAIRYAAEQKGNLEKQLFSKDEELKGINEEFAVKEQVQEEKKRGISEEMGGYKSKLKEADKKRKDYESKGVIELLSKAEDKQSFTAQLKARETEYLTLTAGFQDTEQQFKTLFDSLENEKKDYETTLRGQEFDLQKKFNEDKDALKEYFRKEENDVKDKFQADRSFLKEQLNQKNMTRKESDYKEKEIRAKKYFSREIDLLNENLEEIKKNKISRASSIEIKNNQVASLKKEADYIKDTNNAKAERFSSSNKEEVQSIEEKIKVIDEKLSVHQNAFFGFLQENYPDWYNTIGKVCNEEILFNSNLNPKLLKKGIESLYGIELDLSNVKVYSKTLEEYEVEKSSHLERISVLNQDYLEFKEAQAKEEQQKIGQIGKKTGQLKNEITQLEYEEEQDEQREKALTLDLLEWKRKGDTQREKDLVEIYTIQKETDDEIKNLTAKLNEIDLVLKRELVTVQQNFHTKVSALEKDLEGKIQKVNDQKKEKFDGFESRKEKLQKEKSTVLKKKGIDDSRIKNLKEEIESITADLKIIEENSELVNYYKKDKLELFDKVEEFQREKEKLEGQLKQIDEEFNGLKLIFKKKRSVVDEERKTLSENLRRYTDGMTHFEKHFKERALYDRLRYIIEGNDIIHSAGDIIDLCSQLLANDAEYHKQFDSFKNNITDYVGRFRPDNHFNFRVSQGGAEMEYESFAMYLQDFYNENKIKTSIAEVAKSHGMLIDAIATKVKALTDHRGRINRMVAKMEADFGMASFESSRLIEYIKLKSEDSENKVLKKLAKIAEFKEQNPFLYGEVNLFSSENKAKSDIDKRSVELLNELQKTIIEENYEEIRVQDLFELRFRIKEGKNDTGWIEKIDKVGSTGTDMLVKAVIYITLLNVFIKESTERSAHNFKVHCIIDEVGQISASYLKELISFAEQRNICLVNGLPNESKLETFYNYTYKFRKDQHGNVKVIPLLTMSVEP